jgi:cytochrome c oxidase assembly protein subunit 15
MVPTPPTSNSAPRPALVDGLSLLLGHLVVALIALVAIGGATRVMEAGLACPDWPLCYGSLLPGRQMNLQVFLEWFHRLDAFLVGLTLLVVMAVSLLRRRTLPVWLPWTAGFCLGLVALQGALGAFTVLGLLAPGTVTAHLLTALLLVLVVAGCSDAVRALPRSSDPPSAPPLPRWWWPLPALATALLFSQCFLGGAMASRWASSLCLESGEGCRWLLLHRFGAWGALTALLVLGAGSLALPKGHRPVAIRALTASLLAPLQVLLGVLTLRLQLGAPLVTVAHQLLAALLVAVLGSLWGQALILSSSARAIPASPSFQMAHG